MGRLRLVTWRGLTAQYSPTEIDFFMARLPEDERLFIHGLKGLFDASMEEIFPHSSDRLRSSPGFIPQARETPAPVEREATSLGAGLLLREVSRGWAQDLDTGSTWEPFDRPVLGLAAAQKFPDVDLARHVVREGVRRHPNALWIVAHGRGEAQEALLEELELLQAEVFITPDMRWYNKTWQGRGMAWLVGEMSQGCTEVLVLHTPGAKTEAFRGKPHIKMLERGEAVAKARNVRRSATTLAQAR